jgi:Uma2 family endonuclease
MTTKLPPRHPGRGGLPLPEELHLPVDNVRVIPDPDAPDDREPLPDGMQQEEAFYDAVTMVKDNFRGRPGVLVSGNTPVYYLDEDGRQQTCRPDCYVAFGVDPIAVRRRNGYFIARVGKSPDFVLEIASISTFRNDLGPKRDLYARLGIEEYWRFDATGEFYPEPLAGEVLVDGEYRPMEVRRDSEGTLRGYSPMLGLDLCWDRGSLRLYDPVTQSYRHTLEEAQSDRLAESAARQAAEARASVDAAARQAAETRASVNAAARQAAEARASVEAAARQAAESALASERARIQQLEEELRQRQSEG